MDEVAISLEGAFAALGLMALPAGIAPNPSLAQAAGTVIALPAADQLAPGAGMVAMVQIRSISAMLIYNDHTKRGKLLQRLQ
jgi:hypothetical protein